MWSNFHTHNQYCDGKGDLATHIAHAEKLNLISLGFSSHAPLPFPNKWCMKPESLADYLATISAAKAKSTAVEIYAGLEVDYIPETISPNDFRDTLDYTIGSIHFVEQFGDGRRWEIDGPHAFFLEGFEKIFNHNIQDVIVRYFELTREMISTSCPTVVGHLDKIKIQNIDHKFFHEEDAWYQQEIKKTIDLIAESGSIVEVNTRGIYQQKCDTTYPSPWVLEYILKKNVPIMISSDAHHPDDLIQEFSNTAVMLEKLGFQKLTILHHGRWQPYSFNANGIIHS